MPNAPRAHFTIRAHHSPAQLVVLTLCAVLGRAPATAYAEDAPPLQAPMPQAPPPQAPTPQEATPQAPTPQAPTPQEATPQAPTPQAPTPPAAEPALSVEQPAALPAPLVPPRQARSPAQATDTERAPTHDGPGPRLRWYGWQTVAADLASFGLMVLGGENNEPGLFLFGLGTYIALSPVVHMLHDNAWALDSLLLRAAATGLLIGGAVVLFSSCPLFADHCSDAGSTVGGTMIIGGLLLGVAMPFVDGALAFDKPDRSGVAVTPWLSPRADAGGLALVGSL